MSNTPDTLVLKRHRDVDCRRKEVWVRRSLLALVAAIPVLALFNLFGQKPHVARAVSNAAELELFAPGNPRSGLTWEARFTVDARRELRNATLVLDRGWTEGLTINTIEPSPVDEASRDGKLVLELGHVPAEQRYVLYVELQVNPTTVGRRGQTVRLYDGNELLATLRRTVTVFP